MSVEVAAWNVAKGLGSSERREAIMEGLKRLDADIVVLSEAFATDSSTSTDFYENMWDPVDTFAEENGYDYTRTAYEDADTTRLGSPDGFEQHLMVLDRRTVPMKISPMRLGTRNGFELLLSDGRTDRLGIHAVVAHFDDRSEALRQGMIDAILPRLNVSQPTLLMGDLNAMHQDSGSAHLMRTKLAGFAAEHVPHARTKWTATRIIEMADGSTMGRLIKAGLEDADPDRHHTFKFKGVPFGQLDHIMTARLAVKNFTVSNLPGSDHKAISATLSTY